MIPEPVRFDPGAVRTAANGSFQTPPLLQAGSTYRVVVRAAGFATAISDWITLRGESNAMPPLTVRALRTVAGRVVDRQGRPIASVQVFQPGNGPSATTDEAGRFQLGAVQSGRSILLARREGLRFGGALIDDKNPGPVELTLSRPDEPPDRTIATLPGPIPQEESLRLARRVLGPYLKQVVVKGNDPAKLWCLRILLLAGSAPLLEYVQKLHFDRGNTADFLRGEAALAFVADDPEEAATIAETIADPAYRAGTLVDLADVTPAADRRGNSPCSTVPCAPGAGRGAFLEQALPDG